MGLTLQNIPGFTDLPNSAIVADSVAYGIRLGQISENAAFGEANLETFVGWYTHGQNVALPVSGIDGYKYARTELLYFWSVANSTDQNTGWIGGADSLWFTNWNVDQTTGAVFSEEWYRRSGQNANPVKTNDGLLQVFTIAQRRRGALTMASAASYSAITASWIGIDKPLSQQLIQGLNNDAKFAAVKTEIFYLGEYVDGDTVSLPTSTVDGHSYSFAECKLLHAWRWTTSGAAYVAPPFTTFPFASATPEQLGPFTCSINASTGVVTITVKYIYNGGQNIMTVPNYGRVAVFAFCRRSATPGSLPLANNFAELDSSLFFPGSTLRATPVPTQQIDDNINQAILTPEFFGPTTYANGATVALPVSPIDGYTYSRAELTYIWSWSDTTNQTGSHLRIPLFYGDDGTNHTTPINVTTGVVGLHVWRLPPGGPYLDDNDTLCRIQVIIVARRQASLGIVVPSGTISAPGNASSAVVDVNGTPVEVNGTAVPDIANLNDTLPAAPSGYTNIKWQQNTAVDPDTISAYWPVKFSDNETPSGTVNGSNATFVLAHTPSPVASLQLYVNGQLMTNGATEDFTLATATITFATPPDTGSNIRAWYRY